MPSKIILDLCGGTGSWSRPYKKGYDVVNITLPDYDVTDYSFDGKFILFRSQNPLDSVHVRISAIHGILAAPPYTKFTKANWRVKKNDRDFKEGMKCVRACMEIIWGIQEHGAPLAFWALENPMGYLYNFMGKPAFYFQPWQFGDQSFLATKRTAIWGYFKQPAKTVLKRTIPFISPHSSKRDQVSKQIRNKGWDTSNVETRAITPPEFAEAFFKANP